MSRTTSKKPHWQTILDNVAALNAASASPAVAETAATFDEQLVLIPRSAAFWSMELRDLARCRELLRPRLTEMLKMRVETITSQMAAADSVRVMTVDFLDEILSLPNSFTVEFIDAWEQRLKKFKYVLPHEIVVYRDSLGLTPEADDDFGEAEEHN